MAPYRGTYESQFNPNTGTSIVSSVHGGSFGGSVCNIWFNRLWWGHKECTVCLLLGHWFSGGKLNHVNSRPCVFVQAGPGKPIPTTRVLIGFVLHEDALLLKTTLRANSLWNWVMLFGGLEEKNRVIIKNENVRKTKSNKPHICTLWCVVYSRHTI